ncbi:MAG: hypothetical protein ACFFCQ_07985 [Promethearchaeota archaeon]
MRRFDELILLIGQYFLNKNIAYAIRGGVAVLFQGRFRTTEDIDIIINPENFEIQDFIDFCQKNTLTVDPYDLKEGLIDRSQITIMDFPNSIRVDMRYAFTKWDKGAIKRAEIFSYKNQKISVISPEYLIINKIYKSGRIDLEDAYSVYFQNESRINFDLMEQLAELLKVKKEYNAFIKKVLEIKD